MSDRPPQRRGTGRFAALLRRLGVVACAAALCAGLYLLLGIAVTTDPRSGQERLNGQGTSAPLIAPLVLLLGGAVGLVLLLPARRS